jgi:PleD family two-component response regulator
VDAAGLKLSAQRILAQLRQSQWLQEDKRIGMTVSMGGVTIVPGEMRSALLARADAMLYASKCNGRDGISVG